MSALRRKSVQEPEAQSQSSSSRPSTSNGLLAPRPGTARTNSDESRTGRTSFRHVVNRLRSSSSASSLGGKSRVDDNDIYDWFQGFRRYNELVTTEISPSQSYDAQAFAKATKTLTKNCGGQLIHGLPEAAFDFGLLWCPTSDLVRRDTNEPSWSWTAYSGSVNFPLDPSTCPDIYNTPKAAGELFRSEIQNFHIGPASSPYTVRREKNGSLRMKYPAYFHAPRGADASKESNTLRFTTQTISADRFRSEQLHHNDTELPCSQLFDAQDRHCGIIMDRLSSLSTPSPVGPFEFVLLSRTKCAEAVPHTRRPTNPTIHPPGVPVWDGERFLWDEVVQECGEELKEGEWKMLNVMLIRWDGDVAERVAIARIHEDVWESEGPVRKEVVLQ
jgi:hypothetical protein